MSKKDVIKPLTCPVVRIQSVGRVRGKRQVDATKRRIKQTINAIERKMRVLHEQRETLRDMLKITGIDMDEEDVPTPTVNVLDYIDLPFEGMTLVDACKKIMTDHPGQVLTKAYIERTVKMGGYQFTATDTRNSIEVTMRRLVRDQFCEARRVPGSRAHEYAYVEKK